MNRLVIFRGRVPDEKPSGQKYYDQYWCRTGDLMLSGMFPSCEMLFEHIVERTRFLSAHLQPWTIELGSDQGFEFIPGVGMFQYVPFSSEQKKGLWLELCG